MPYTERLEVDWLNPQYLHIRGQMQKDEKLSLRQLSRGQYYNTLLFSNFGHFEIISPVQKSLGSVQIVKLVSSF